jgi:hypothetical protein
MAGRWKWKSWRKDAKSKTLVIEWLEAANIYVKTAFKARVKHLDGQPPANWRRPFVSTLEGGKKERGNGCKGLVEIRFEVKNVQYRPLGYYSGEHEFTIVFFAEERDGKFDPPTACEIAKTRIAEIKKDPKKVHEWWIERRNGKGNSKK